MANENNNVKKISNSEKTNAKNLENTHIVNAILASVNGVYNPNNLVIREAAMQEFETTFTLLTQNVIAAIASEQNVVGDQLAAFKPVSKRVTMIMKAVRGQNLDPEFVEHLKSTVNRLNGVRVNKTTPDTSPAPEGETKRTVSVARRSYAGILESLSLLAEQLKSNAGYNPNEEEYKSATISAWVDELKSLHNAALEAKVATRTARNQRSAYVFHRTEGLMTRMKAVKNYVATILPPTDTRLKQLKNLKFVDYMR